MTPRTRLIVITNLHNPTSAWLDEATLAEVGRLAARAGARVLVDEIYLDATFAAAPRSAFHLDEVFVTTSSLTKVYGLSGLRCGWILASAGLAERMWRLNELMGVAQPHAAERLGTIALAHLDEIAAPLRPLLDANREIVRAFLAKRPDLEIHMPEAGITLFPRWRGGDVDALNDRLRTRYDASIVPGRFFGCPEHFRLGIGSDSTVLEEGLRRLGAALDELAPR